MRNLENEAPSCLTDIRNGKRHGMLTPPRPTRPSNAATNVLFELHTPYPLTLTIYTEMCGHVRKNLGDYV